MNVKKIKSFKNTLPLNKEISHIIEEELDNYLRIQNNTLPEKIIKDNILKRKKCIFEDKNYNRPQNIFYMYFDKLDLIIFGRKTISPLYKKKLISSINCSMITENMIIGVLYDSKMVDNDIKISYYPLTDGERQTLFNLIRDDRSVNIEYPFKFLDYYSHKEIDSPSDGWRIDNKIEENLFNGEYHLRKYTIDFLKKVLKDENKIIFDPACSTGDFLYNIKNHFKKVTIIGQDLSIDMVNCAKSKLDVVYHGNSIETKVPDKNVDFIFFRFLNSKVVTTENATKLYDSLIEKVKINGYIICFGHTPLLLMLNSMKKENLELLSCNGYDDEYDCVFQYYIFRRCV